MTPDNFSFMWAFLVLALLVVFVDVVDHFIGRRKRVHRTGVALGHAEHDQMIQRWETRAIMQQMREDHAQAQLIYGAPGDERTFDVEATSQ